MIRPVCHLLFPGVLLFPIAQAAPPTQDGVGTLSLMLERYGPWVTISLALGYVLLKNWLKVQDENAANSQSLKAEIKEVREQHLKATEGLLTRATIAIEKNTERIDICPHAIPQKDE